MEYERQSKFCNGSLRTWALPERFEKTTWTSDVAPEDKTLGARAQAMEEREMNRWYSVVNAMASRKILTKVAPKTREIRRRELEAILGRKVEY